MSDALLLHGSPWVVRAAGDYVRGGAVCVEGDRIVAVGPTADLELAFPAARRIDCAGAILIPGLVNCHNHVYEITCRGLLRTSGTECWLRELIYPVNRRLDDEDHYYATLLACADGFRTGTTCIVDQMTNFARFHVDAEFQGFVDARMRARVGRASSTASTIDPEENGSPEEELRATEAFLDRWRNQPLVHPWVSPSGLFSCDPETLRQLKALASAKESKFKIHLSETRVQLDLAHKHGYPGQIDWAYRTGLLDEDTLVAHAVWASDAEIDILASTGAQVSHNPSSNMVLASGVANVPRMLEKGVHVALGSDGPASNDAQDMVAEMKAAVLLHRVATLDPTILDAQTAFRMATEAGAKVIGLEGEVGRLEPGYLADIAGVRIEGNPCLQPVYDPVAALVYYGSGRDVCLTIVNGEVVYRDGSYPTLDLDRTLQHLSERTAPKVLAALGAAREAVPA